MIPNTSNKPKPKGRPRKVPGAPTKPRAAPKPKKLDPYYLPPQGGASVIQELLAMFPRDE